MGVGVAHCAGPRAAHAGPSAPELRSRCDAPAPRRPAPPLPELPRAQRRRHRPALVRARGAAPELSVGQPGGCGHAGGALRPGSRLPPLKPLLIRLHPPRHDPTRHHPGTASRCATPSGWTAPRGLRSAPSRAARASPTPSPWTSPRGAARGWEGLKRAAGRGRSGGRGPFVGARQTVVPAPRSACFALLPSLTHAPIACPNPPRPQHLLLARPHPDQARRRPAGHADRAPQGHAAGARQEREPPGGHRLVGCLMGCRWGGGVGGGRGVHRSPHCGAASRSSHTLPPRLPLPIQVAPHLWRHGDAPQQVGLRPVSPAPPLSLASWRRRGQPCARVVTAHWAACAPADSPPATRRPRPPPAGPSTPPSRPTPRARGAGSACRAR
jgi:hypothetical protein